MVVKWKTKIYHTVGTIPTSRKTKIYHTVGTIPKSRETKIYHCPIEKIVDKENQCPLHKNTIKPVHAVASIKSSSFCWPVIEKSIWI